MKSLREAIFDIEDQNPDDEIIKGLFTARSQQEFEQYLNSFAKILNTISKQRPSSPRPTEVYSGEIGFYRTRGNRVGLIFRDRTRLMDYYTVHYAEFLHRPVTFKNKDISAIRSTNLNVTWKYNNATSKLIQKLKRNILPQDD